MKRNKRNSKDVRDHIKVVDLFAGPGGLGEGFSSHDEFRIVVSAEMESSAHATLRLRAFYRNLRRNGGKALLPYFRICNGESQVPTDDQPLAEWDELTSLAWKNACKEALKLTLGDPADNKRLDDAIKDGGISADNPWVLIGGPPCQAYSLVGRARNRGKDDYRPEDDHRHYLYKEYLRIIQQYQPHIFVMENVKGILSSKIDGQKIFHEILRDLSNPAIAVGNKQTSRKGYRIHSLVSDVTFGHGDNPEDIDAREFIVRAEQYGVPQARHRVILVGVREDILEELDKDSGVFKLKHSLARSVKDVIGDLPRLRSKLSKADDSWSNWSEVVSQHAKELAKAARSTPELKNLAKGLRKLSVQPTASLPTTAHKQLLQYKGPIKSPATLRNWYVDQHARQMLKRYLNHEARGHMSSDLRRYLFAAVYAGVNKVSPKGHEGFSLPGLRPDHENWESGKFSDRFRVQLRDQPATTVTSHIAKDGHYFIHFDPKQCRSLTVREAARLQTFPDDYFFQGNRTQQYHQVGNAVPPFLAHQLAKLIQLLFDKR